MKPIIVKLAKDRGLTGLAIKTAQIVVAHEGEYHDSYAPEIDNCIVSGSTTVRNCIMGACFDKKGNLRGVVSIQNKKEDMNISDEDVQEFSNLLPIVAEIINQIDKQKYVKDVLANLKLSLTTSKESILSSTKIFEEKEIT